MASGFAASTLGVSFALSASPCSGAIFGDSTLMDGFARYWAESWAGPWAVGAGVASGEFGAAGPAPTTSPRLSLTGCCSLTSKSPAMVDHLVTFIACEFVTAAKIAEILGCHPALFRRIQKPKRGGSAKNPALLLCGIGFSPPCI